VLAMICPLNNRPCRCDPSAADKKFHPCALARRIGVLIRLCGSSFEGEATSALSALRRLLPAEGLAFSDLAVLIENCDGRIETLRYSEDDANAIFARGIEAGSKQGAGRVLSASYFNDDGEPRWQEIARFCQSRQASLNPKEQEFVDEMPLKLRWRMPSLPQGGFLLSIFWKLRGSLK
jgi:hypothetical protein